MLANLAYEATSYSLRHTTTTWLVGKGLSRCKVTDYLGSSEDGQRTAYLPTLWDTYLDGAAIAETLPVGVTTTLFVNNHLSD